MPYDCSMADSCLTIYVTNFGTVRRAESNGRDYYVAPVTLIVPGVLPGSLGPTFYPRDEVALSVNRWEGVELTLDHPQAIGKRIVVGMVKAPKIRGGNLVAEAWVDAALAKEADNRILETLQRNKNMEVSTGLIVLHQKKEGVWKGREYQAVARDYQPDHLALLPDKIGACSVKDGCGLNVINCSCKKGATMDETQREELITKLIENSNGLFSEDDTEALGQFDDNRLLAMRKQQVANAKKAKAPVTNTEEDGDDPKPKAKAKATKTRPVANKRRRPVENTEDDDDDAQPQGKTPVFNMQAEIGKYMKGLTAEEFYELAPTEVQEVLATAKRTHNERKVELIEELTRHCTNSEVKETLAENFLTKDIEELELLATAFNKPSPSDNNPFALSYVGNAGSPRPTPDAMKKDREDFLPLPVMNWDETKDAVAV